MKIPRRVNSISYWYFSKNSLPHWGILILDCMIILFSGLLSTYICEGGDGVVGYFWKWVLLWIASLPCYVIGMRVFHTYSGVMRFSSVSDFIRISGALFIGGALFGIVTFLLPEEELIPHIIWVKEILLQVVVALLLCCTMRIFVKAIYDVVFTGHNTERVFIYGVRQGGIALAESIRQQTPRKYIIKGFVSYEKDMQGKYLMGQKVYAPDEKLISHMFAVGAKSILVSPLYNEQFRNDERLVNELVKSDIKMLMLPPSETWDGKSKLSYSQLHEVEIEDLLPRDKIEVDMDAIGKLLRDKVIMITGSAGSIGSEMVRQIAKYKPHKLLLIDQAETPMHNIRLLMARQFPYIEAYTIVSSITRKDHMEEIFFNHRPDYVFHAAAYKHVPMMEDNPGVAIQNNCYGTRVIADLAVKYDTKKFVMISTDKAVNPTNVMGCSKRICEIYCQSLNKAILEGKVLNGKGEKACTQFITTRFGNVLGSNGSVIPIFKEQLKKGGPLTVTHPDIIRFFMLIPEACQLVLEAGTMGHGGEIFVFDMGKPVRIADLAQRMIDLSHAKGVEIKYTGLRDGEKLYEEVLSDKEQTIATSHPKILVAKVREYDYATAKQNEEELLELSHTYDDMAIVKKMKAIVPEYRSQHSKYEVLDNR